MHGLFSKVSTTTQGITMSIKREAAAMYSQYQQNIQNSSENREKNETNNTEEENPFQQVAVPPGTIPPGTYVTVGNYNVVIEKHLAEGGFAHVYIAQTQDGKKIVLKQIIVMDKEQALIFQKEINIMKIVNGNENIVGYIDSQIRTKNQNEGEGYEILILMEYCSGGHIVDLMNSRLQVRLNENEILNIFTSVCKAVAHLHYQNPPIIHRDIKVENVLITADGKYKLCDFGSATTQIVPPNKSLSIQEIHMLEEEIQKYTTIQYRPPEMCDIYQKRGLNEKVDTWALGIMLYKLCYYTTPFEDGNTLAILNCRYTKPAVPVYSNNIHHLIDMMLIVEPYQRATIYDILSFLSSIQGVPCPIPNKYQYSESNLSPINKPVKTNDNSFYSNSTNSILTTKKQPVVTIPIVQNANPVPMRRGRPIPKDKKVNPASNANAVVASKIATLSYNSQQMQQSDMNSFKALNKTSQDENKEELKKAFYYSPHNRNNRNSLGLNSTVSSIELNQFDQDSNIASKQSLDTIFGKSTNDLFDSSSNNANLLFDDNWVVDNSRKSFEKSNNRKSIGENNSNTKLPRPPSFTQLVIPTESSKNDEGTKVIPSIKTPTNVSNNKNEKYSLNPFSSNNNINSFDNENENASIQLFETDFEDNTISLLGGITKSNTIKSIDSSNSNKKNNRSSFYDNNEIKSIKSINSGNSKTNKNINDPFEDFDNSSPYGYISIENDTNKNSSLNKLNEKTQNLLSTNSSQIISTYNNNNTLNPSTKKISNTMNTNRLSGSLLDSTNINENIENKFEDSFDKSYDVSTFSNNSNPKSFFDSLSKVNTKDEKGNIDNINTNTNTNSNTNSNSNSNSHSLSTNKINNSLHRLANSLKGKQSKRGKHILLNENSFDNDDNDDNSNVSTTNKKEDQQKINATYISLNDDNDNENSSESDTDEILVQNGKLVPPKNKHVRYPSDSLYTKEKSHQKTKSVSNIRQDNFTSLNFEMKENFENNSKIPSNSKSNITISEISAIKNKKAPLPPPKPPQLSNYIIPKSYPGLPPRQSSSSQHNNKNNLVKQQQQQQQQYGITSSEKMSSNNNKYLSLNNINSQNEERNNNGSTSNGINNRGSGYYFGNSMSYQNIEESYDNNDDVDNGEYSDENDSDQDIFGSKSNKKKSKFKLLRGSNKLI